jgi:hypothetical protein
MNNKTCPGNTCLCCEHFYIEPLDTSPYSDVTPGDLPVAFCSLFHFEYEDIEPLGWDAVVELTKKKRVGCEDFKHR